MHLCVWLGGVPVSWHWLAWTGPPTCQDLRRSWAGGPGVVHSAGDSAELVFPGLAGGVEGWAGPSPLLLGVMGP